MFVVDEGSAAVVVLGTSQSQTAASRVLRVGVCGLRVCRRLSWDRERVLSPVPEPVAVLLGKIEGRLLAVSERRRCSLRLDCLAVSLGEEGCCASRWWSAVFATAVEARPGAGSAGARASLRPTSVDDDSALFFL